MYLDKITLPCTDQGRLDLRGCGKYLPSLARERDNITFSRTPIQPFTLIIFTALNILFKHTTDLFDDVKKITSIHGAHAMTRPLPHQLSQTLGQQWPCRETQIRQLAALLDVSITPFQLNEYYLTDYAGNSLKYPPHQP